MSKKFIFEGKCEFKREDSGAALVAQIDDEKEDGLFVKIQSWDEDCLHTDASALTGKQVRVTVEVLKEADAGVEHPIIPAECHSDDHEVEVEFNAGRWLVEASDEDILDLLKCGCGGDYGSDAVAEHMAEHNEEVAIMYDYIEAHNRGKRARGRDTVGFECHVQVAPLMVWLSENKPEIYAQAMKDEYICGALKLVDWNHDKEDQNIS